MFAPHESERRIGRRLSASGDADATWNLRPGGALDFEEERIDELCDRSHSPATTFEFFGFLLCCKESPSRFFMHVLIRRPHASPMPCICMLLYSVLVKLDGICEPSRPTEDVCPRYKPFLKSEGEVQRLTLPALRGNHAEPRMPSLAPSLGGAFTWKRAPALLGR